MLSIDADVEMNLKKCSSHIHVGTKLQFTMQIRCVVYIERQRFHYKNMAISMQARINFVVEHESNECIA